MSVQSIPGGVNRRGFNVQLWQLVQFTDNYVNCRTFVELLFNIVVRVLSRDGPRVSVFSESNRQFAESRPVSLRLYAGTGVIG